VGTSSKTMITRRANWPGSDTVIADGLNVIDGSGPI
jgi:hypothetical protein